MDQNIAHVFTNVKLMLLHKGKGTTFKLWWKSRFNKKMCLYLKKTFVFQKQQDLLKRSGYYFFPGFYIFPMGMHLTACLVFCLVMIVLLKLLGLKVYFHSASGTVSYFTDNCESKIEKRKFILHMNMFKAVIFQHGLNLNISSQIKDSSSWN